MQGRSQRVVCEVLLPQARRQLSNTVGGVYADPLQHIDQVSVGIDAVQSASDDEALHDAKMLGAELGPAEQPVFAPHRDDTQAALQMIGVQRQVRIIEEQLEPSPTLVCIGQRAGQRRLGRNR